MKRLAMILLALSLASAAPAQTEAEAGDDARDDRSRLVRFLEDALSDGAAREVRIEGFRGALSSSATLDLLTVADAGGVWLTIEEAELVWTRSALLRGALEVDRLSAGRVMLERLPEGGGATPEATPFSLPELPISISLGQLRIDRVDLGEAVLGFPMSASASGAASLAGGQGDARFDLRRLDGPRGAFALAAGFDNATTQLDLSLSLEEDAGGVAATLLGVPDRPSVALDVTGGGPLDDLTVTLLLATDGRPRLAGTVTAGPAAGGAQSLDVSVSGDLAPLVLPGYRPFFGTEIGLEARTLRGADGALTLERFHLQTAALSLGGTAAIAPDGAPEGFRVAGHIRDPAGAPVRLPIGGATVEVAAADLLIGYDRATGDRWDGLVSVAGLRVDDLTAETARLALDGTIGPPGAEAAMLSAAGQAELAGLGHPDTALRTALGQSLQLGFGLSWTEDAPILLRDLALISDRARFDGSGSLDLARTVLDAEFDLSGAVPDLAPFSGLAGQPLAGSAQLSVTGQAELLSGAFAMTVEGTGTGLDFGDGLSPTLLAGETALGAELRRDAGGVHLDRLDLSGAALTASATGRLSSGDSTLSANARLTDARLLTPALGGPIDADVTLDRSAAAAPWRAEARATGQGGLTTALTGRVGLPGGAVDVTLSGSAPLALADPFLAPRSVRGTATYELDLRGPPALSALSGTVSTAGARVALPTLGLVLDDTDLTARLAGSRVELSGSGAVDAGGRFTLDGGLDLSAGGFPGRIDLGLSGLVLQEGDLAQTVVETGAIRIEGPLAAGPSVSGDILLGQTDILLEELSLGASEPIPEIRHLGADAAQTATRDRAGITGAGGAVGVPVPLDLTVSAPARIFLRGRGLDAELGGRIRLGGTSADVAPSGQFDLIRGRLSLLGQRFDMDAASITLQGSLDPYLRVVALTRAGEVTVTILLEGPASAPVLSLTSVPDLPEDEILSRLLFGRSASSLSPVQAIQLVDAVSGFAGGGGLISGLRDRLGVDDFDLTTDAEGAAELRLGRYLSENIYSEVEIGQGGDTEVFLNLDLTPNVTARGGFASDGESSVGVFFERDY